MVARMEAEYLASVSVSWRIGVTVGLCFAHNIISIRTFIFIALHRLGLERTAFHSARRCGCADVAQWSRGASEDCWRLYSTGEKQAGWPKNELEGMKLHEIGLQDGFVADFAGASSLDIGRSLRLLYVHEPARCRYVRCMGITEMGSKTWSSSRRKSGIQ